MAAVTNAFMDKKFIGNPVALGTSAARYQNFMTADETVEMEFKGIRDAMVFTNKRIIVIDPQGIRGKKVAVISFPWARLTAFSLENSGTFDLEAELKICGSGFGVCEVMFTKGTDVSEVAAFINQKLL